MTETMNRIAIRPLSRILPARLRGEDPNKIEKENLKIRHDTMRDVERVTSNIRLLLIIVMRFVQSFLSLVVVIITQQLIILLHL